MGGRKNTGSCGRSYCRSYYAGLGRAGADALVIREPAALQTAAIGSIDTQLAYNEGAGINQAVGALAFCARGQRMASNIAAYALDNGSGTGSFQMAILQPLSAGSAVVLAVTATAASLTSGVFTLPLTSRVVLACGRTYYLAVYNQVIDSALGAISVGLASTQDAPPVNFRAQNIAGFTVDISDASLRIHALTGGILNEHHKKAAQAASGGCQRNAKRPETGRLADKGIPISILGAGRQHPRKIFNRYS